MKVDFKWMVLDNDGLFTITEDPKNLSIGCQKCDPECEIRKGAMRDKAYGLCWRTIHKLGGSLNPSLDKKEMSVPIRNKIDDVAEAQEVLHDGILDMHRRNVTIQVGD